MFGHLSHHLAYSIISGRPPDAPEPARAERHAAEATPAGRRPRPDRTALRLSIASGHRVGADLGDRPTTRSRG